MPRRSAGEAVIRDYLFHPFRRGRNIQGERKNNTAAKQREDDDESNQGQLSHCTDESEE